MTNQNLSERAEFGYGFGSPKSSRQYERTDDPLYVEFMGWLKDVKDFIGNKETRKTFDQVTLACNDRGVVRGHTLSEENFFYSLALQRIMRTPEIEKRSSKEINGLLLGTEYLGIHDDFRGIFLGACYNFIEDGHVVFDLDLDGPPGNIGYGCLKRLVVKGDTHSVRCPFDGGPIVANFGTVKQLLQGSTVINYGKADTICGSTIVNYGEVRNVVIAHDEGMGILINFGELGKSNDKDNTIIINFGDSEEFDNFDEIGRTGRFSHESSGNKSIDYIAVDYRGKGNMSVAIKDAGSERPTVFDREFTKKRPRVLEYFEKIRTGVEAGSRFTEADFCGKYVSGFNDLLCIERPTRRESQYKLVKERVRHLSRHPLSVSIEDFLRSLRLGGRHER